MNTPDTPVRTVPVEASRRPGARAAHAAGRALHTVWPAAVLAICVIALWEILVRAYDVDPAVFPSASAVARALTAQFSTIMGHVGTTLAETGIGLLIGAILGIAVACVISAWDLARRAVEPFLVVLQTIPPVVLAPLLVLALGYGWAPRIVVVVGVVFFPVAIATAGALRGVDPVRIDLVRSLGASRTRVLRTVTLPEAVPAIFDGLRISAAYAVGAAAVAEQFGGAKAGIGLFISRSQRSFRPDQVLAGVVVIAVLSILVYGLVSLLATWATPWTRRPTPTSTSIA